MALQEYQRHKEGVPGEDYVEMVMLQRYTLPVQTMQVNVRFAGGAISPGCFVGSFSPENRIVSRSVIYILKVLHDGQTMFVFRRFRDFVFDSDGAMVSYEWGPDEDLVFGRTAGRPAEIDGEFGYYILPPFGFGPPVFILIEDVRICTLQQLFHI